MSKKFIYLIFFVSVLWLTAVPAQAYTHRVVYWDGAYPQAWVDAGAAIIVRDYLELNGYTVVDAAQLKTWMDARIADGALSVVVFAKDIVPDTVAEPTPAGDPQADCTIR